MKAGALILGALVLVGAAAAKAQQGPVYLPVLKGGLISPDLVVRWWPGLTEPSAGIPDHWDADWGWWVWIDKNGKRLTQKPDELINVQTREAVRAPSA